MRIVFMGTSDFAVPSLKALWKENFQVVGVVTRPDKPRGRGQQVAASPIKDLAASREVELYQPPGIGDQEALSWLADLAPDVLVVVAYGQILPEKILAIPARGAVNVHASLLPRYRGAAPVQRAIINGEEETGVSTIFMDEGVDTGDIIYQDKMPINPNDTHGIVNRRLAILGAQLLVRSLKDVAAGKAPRRAQDDREATYAPALVPDEEKINWEDDARRIVNLVRGMNPTPGAYTMFDGQRLKVWQAHLVGDSYLPDAPGGEIVRVENKLGFTVRARNGLVRLDEVQPQNKNAMTGAAYARGRHLRPGLLMG